MKQKTQAEVLVALAKSRGVISIAAEMLGLASPNSLRTRVKNDPKLSAAREEIMESVLDKAEDNILKAINDGDKEISWRYLTRKGKARGYGDSLEVNGNLNVKKKIDLSNLSEEELAELEKIVSKTTNAG